MGHLALDFGIAWSSAGQITSTGSLEECRLLYQYAREYPECIIEAGWRVGRATAMISHAVQKEGKPHYLEEARKRTGKWKGPEVSLLWIEGEEGADIAARQWEHCVWYCSRDVKLLIHSSSSKGGLAVIKRSRAAGFIIVDEVGSLAVMERSGSQISWLYSYT